jgi:hypothetical protein
LQLLSKRMLVRIFELRGASATPAKPSQGFQRGGEFCISKLRLSGFLAGQFASVWFSYCWLDGG